MTALYIRTEYAWCRVRSVGGDEHVTACLDRLAVDVPREITSTKPDDLCSACGRDERVRRSRSDTRELRPRGADGAEVEW